MPIESPILRKWLIISRVSTAVAARAVPVPIEFVWVNLNVMIAIVGPRARGRYGASSGQFGKLRHYRTMT